MKIKLFLFAGLLLVLPFNGYAYGQISGFLKLGMTSPEVKTMQQILNTDPITRVSAVGVGSPGFETNYFGMLTHKAVLAFQSKNGLKADGLVGAMTREKLNAKLITNGISTTTSSIIYPAGQNPNLVYPTNPSANQTSTLGDINTLPSSSQTEILIDSMSPINVAPGQTIDVFGSGFSKNMYAYIDIKNNINFDFLDSSHIKITIPSGEEEGSKWISLANTRTDTRWTQPAFVLVTNSPVRNSGDQFWDTYKTIQQQNNKFLALANKKSTPWGKIKEQLVGIFDGVFPVKPKVAYAQVNNFFGGKIVSTTPCLCPANPGSIIHLNNLVVGGASSVGYSNIYSKLHSNYNVSLSGVQILGGTTPSTFSCQEPAYPQGCQEIDSADSTIDLLRGVGTSPI